MPDFYQVKHKRQMLVPPPHIEIRQMYFNYIHNKQVYTPLQAKT